MTKIPEIRDNHYNLVVIDKRRRYPEVEKLHTTACKQTKEKLKKIFFYGKICKIYGIERWSIITF
jgi:hypothetical protein